MSLFRVAQTQRHPLLPVALLVASLASTTVAYMLTRGTGGLAVLWINNGLLAASLLLLPRGPAIQLAILCTLADGIAAAIGGSPPAQAMLIAGCDLAESVAVAALVRRVAGARLDMTSLSRFRRVALLAVLPATLVVPTAGSLLSAWLFGADLAELWPVWAGGDVLGMMIGLPGALVLIRFNQFNHGAPAGRIERLALLAIAVATGVGIFIAGDLPLLYLIFPVVLLLVLRLSPPYSLAGILAFSLVAAGATVAGDGPIAASAARMSDRILWLQLYLASLQFSALALISVLTERDRAQNALKRALATARETRSAAIEAAGVKGRFLAVMSHEMRTPLNGIAGYTQLLGSRRDLPDDARAQIATIGHSSEVLLGLISDVLDYSRAESGGLQLVEQPFRLAEVVSRSLDVVRPLLAGRNIVLEVDTGGLDDRIHRGDERRLTQVLMNLLGNAVKFTEQGSIRLTLQARPSPTGESDDLVIAVTDTGIGIPADKLDLLFSPFSQVDVSDRRSFAGAGLGLAISQALIQRMGGTIGVESREGEGSRFWVALTLPRCAALPADVVDTSPGIEGRAVRVLVVDDHAVNRQVATLMLEAAGFEVSTAENGAMAVASVQSDPCDIVFMDLHMPVMDGLAACRAIRALDGPSARTPVIAMTAAAMPEDIERCLAAGMSGHIAKPIRQDELLRTALRVLAVQDLVDAA